VAIVIWSTGVTPGGRIVTPASVARARQQWETLEVRKRAIAARMGEIDDLKQKLLA
jgi:hypothetical protein